MANLTPWRAELRSGREKQRIRRLMPAKGYWAVMSVEYTARVADGGKLIAVEPGEIEVWWEPIVGWAIVREGAEDDQLVGAVIDREIPGGLSLLDDGHHYDWLFTVCTDVDRAERKDEIESGAKDDARDRGAREREEQANKTAIHKFVAAQPNPDAFAASMRQYATHWSQVLNAITEAKGDAELALQIAAKQYRP